MNMSILFEHIHDWVHAGCQYCWVNGHKIGKGATLFRGYATPIMCTKGYLQGELIQIGVDDDRRLISHDEQLARAGLAVQLKQSDPQNFDPGQLGVSGYSVFHSRLRYLDYNSFFLVPVCHALLYGVVKDFTKLVFRRSGCKGDARPFLISQGALRALEQVEQSFVLTQDFGRGYVSQVKRSGRYMSSCILPCPEMLL